MIFPIVSRAKIDFPFIQNISFEYQSKGHIYYTNFSHPRGFHFLNSFSPTQEFEYIHKDKDSSILCVDKKTYNHSQEPYYFFDQNIGSIRSLGENNYIRQVFGYMPYCNRYFISNAGHKEYIFTSPNFTFSSSICILIFYPFKAEHPPSVHINACIDQGDNVILYNDSSQMKITSSQNLSFNSSVYGLRINASSTHVNRSISFTTTSPMYSPSSIIDQWTESSETFVENSVSSSNPALIIFCCGIFLTVFIVIILLCCFFRHEPQREPDFQVITQRINQTQTTRKLCSIQNPDLPKHCTRIETLNFPFPQHMYYCKDCKVLICSRCKKHCHIGHRTKDLLCTDEYYCECSDNVPEQIYDEKSPFFL